MITFLVSAYSQSGQALEFTNDTIVSYWTLCETDKNLSDYKNVATTTSRTGTPTYAQLLLQQK